MTLPKFITTIGLVFVMLASIGCETPGRMSEGVPANAKLVGQGKGFEYVAPADGRLYRMHGGKLDGMKLVRKGEIYRAIGPVEGDDPTKNFDDYQYYFEPAAMSNAPPPTYR